MGSIDAGRKALLEIFHAALARVEGEGVVYRHLKRQPLQGELSLVAIGKAAGAMARGAQRALGKQLVDGLVISKHGHLGNYSARSHPLIGIEGSHPVPDGQSLDAGERLLEYLQGLPPERPLLFLISGGASSLVEVLHPGIGLPQLQAVNRWLLGSGLAIDRMNRIRRALSAIKGGGLLRWIGPRPVQALLISDVAGDDPSVIGSGLLVPAHDEQPASTIPGLPDWLRALLSASPPAPVERGQVELYLLATLRDAREAAAAEARRLGFKTHLSHAFLSADAENAGRRLALELLDSWPGIYVWGGETTVQLPAEPGRGGRNQHLALSAALEMEGRDDVCLLSAGTDGTDGPGEDAGALVDGGTVGRARREGIDAVDALQRADAGTLLAASGDLLHTGPTGTNVMDLVIGLRLESDRGDTAEPDIF